MFRITHMGRCLPNHTLSERGGACRLLPIRHVAPAWLAALRFASFTVGLKHDEIDVTEARSCNQEGDHFWRDPANTNLLGLSNWGASGGRDNSWQAIGALSVRWSRRVCKLLNSNFDPTPDSRTSVIAVCCKLLGTPVAIRLGLVSVPVHHQHRDTPDVDLPYHTGKGSSVYVSNCLPGKTGMAEPSLVWIFITQDPNRKLAVSGDLLPFASDWPDRVCGRFPFAANFNYQASDRNLGFNVHMRGPMLAGTFRF